MKKLLLLLLLSLGLIGNSYAHIVHCSLEEAQSKGFERCYLKHDHEYENEQQLSTDWYENGQKKSEVNVKDGKLNGKYTYWYENGQKMFEANFIDGKWDGKYTEWYENGQIDREGYFEDDKSVGWWRFWLEDGQIDYVKNYDI